jgi:hypothetical protein
VAGAVGPTGAVGPAGPLVFSFWGSTGASQTANFIGGASSCWPVSGVFAGSTPPVTSASGFGSITTISVPAGSTCSSISIQAALTVAPGAFTNASARLARLSGATGLGSGGTVSGVNLCDFNTTLGGGGAGSTSCQATVPVTIAAGDQLAFCIVASGSTPPQTQAAWSVRCLAP